MEGLQHCLNFSVLGPEDLMIRDERLSEVTLGESLLSQYGSQPQARAEFLAGLELELDTRDTFVKAYGEWSLTRHPSELALLALRIWHWPPCSPVNRSRRTAAWA